MSPEQEKVLSKVRKMLALANDTAATEGERDNALRMAHGLLAKYNLSLSHVAMGLDERTEDYFTAPEEWTIRTVAAISRLFFCAPYYQRHRDERGGPWTIRHYFAGKPANVATAQLMAEYVIGSIRREAQKSKDRAFVLSFCAGAGAVIERRCHELIKAAKVEGDATPGTAVVLADYYRTEGLANSEWLRSKVGNLKIKRTLDNRSNAAAFNAGKAFGQTVSLNAQVASPDATKLLGNGGTNAPR